MPIKLDDNLVRYIAILKYKNDILNDEILYMSEIDSVEERRKYVHDLQLRDDIDLFGSGFIPDIKYYEYFIADRKYINLNYITLEKGIIDEQ